jgi:Tol biopolymer transport system component
MPLSSGDRLGPYEIVASIGEGGMGKVYRARDSRLGREVALKVSSARFTDRFEREARAIAALNHPNICTLHDVGPNYLVMELVEGPTLGERIKQGPIPLEEARHIAKQIADAVEAAHEKNIIHRDLKPGNVKIKPDGTVKVLDFGLAKVGWASAGDSPVDPEHSPTLSLAATEAGMILGTAAYMSPEQARGKQVDKRADIWSFGVVLYEMLTGRRLFRGEDAGEILAAVIKEAPDLEPVPASVRPLLRMCLHKDPAKRLHDIGDARLLLDAAPETAPSDAAPAPASPRGHRLAWGMAALAGVIALTAAPFSVAHLREKPPAAAVPVRFQIPMPEKVTLGGGAFSLSPDGRKLVFAATGADGGRRLYLRALDSLEARPLQGTEDVGAYPPFWSPDSRFIGFSIGNKYMKMDTSGGPPQTLCELPGTLGTSTWGPNGVILVMANPSGIYQVPEAGGIPTLVAAPDPAFHDQYDGRATFLPDGRHFLYLRFSNNPEFAGTYVGSLDAKPKDQDRRRLLAGRYGVNYVPSSDPAIGYVLFERDGTLMAQTFDNRKLALTGQPVPIAEQVGNNGAISAFFWASDNGVLAFRSGGQTGRQITWLDGKGNLTSQVGDPGNYTDLALSPDGSRVASFRADQQADIWLYEFARGVSTRFTFAPSIERSPVWSPDGKRIVFASNRGGHFDLYQKNANGAGEDELLLKSDQDKFPTSWSRDGRYLLFVSIDPKTNQDLWALPMDGDRKPAPFLRTEFIEALGSFSPDGRWVAYASNESGRPEIYVRPFSAPGAEGSASAGGKWQISKAGGRNPSWRGDGKELYYIAGDSVMAVDISTSPTLQAGIPQPLFRLAPNARTPQVTPDGKRFLTAISAQQQQANVDPPITVLLNWTALLKK